MTINYNAEGGGAEWDDDNWFDYMKVKPMIGYQCCDYKRLRQGERP